MLTSKSTSHCQSPLPTYRLRKLQRFSTRRAVAIEKETCYNPGRFTRTCWSPGLADRAKGQEHAQTRVECGARCGDSGDHPLAHAFSGVGANGEIGRSHLRKMDDGPDEIREQSRW